MNLSDLAAVGSLVGSGAVALSLVYVALQVRQAEKNQRGLMQQGRANRVSEALLQVATPDMAALYFKGGSAPETLSADELDRYLMICRSAFISGEDSFLQHKAGLLDETAFRSYAAGVRGQFADSRGMRAAWRTISGQFGGEFAAFLDDTLAQVPPPAAADRLAVWAAALQADKAEGPAAPTRP